jgi:hypothetical protein
LLYINKFGKPKGHKFIFTHGLELHTNKKDDPSEASPETQCMGSGSGSVIYERRGMS